MKCVINCEAIVSEWVSEWVSVCVYVCVCLYSGGGDYLIPCWFCTFAHWQRNYQSIILMVGLFEQWETE